RPVVASPGPALFDRWTADYASYVQADFVAFRDALARADSQQRTNGPLRPRLIVRGQDRFTGGAELVGPVRATVDAGAINVRAFLSVGTPDQPMVRYRTALDEMFRVR